MRSISRVADVSINTVTKMLIEAGEATLALHDEHVREVPASRVQCDEIWSFCYAKQKNVSDAKDAPLGSGDVWTWTAIEAGSKLIVSYFVGDRTARSAVPFIQDLSERLANRVQLTTDGHRAYLEAVESAFGDDIDFGQLVKLYGDAPESVKGRYSPAECLGAKKTRRAGRPDEGHISTSYVERQNLTMRMSMRRFTRLTNGFSKKLDNHIYALAPYFFHYNFCRQHKSLGGVSPAMAAGISQTLWSLEDVVKVIDERAPKPQRPKRYKKRQNSN